MQHSQYVMHMHDQENNTLNGAIGKGQDANVVQQRRYVRRLVVVECGHWSCDVGPSMIPLRHDNLVYRSSMTLLKSFLMRFCESDHGVWVGEIGSG